MFRWSGGGGVAAEKGERKERDESREQEARQATRSQVSGQECLLADYLELGKIKRHTHIQPYLLATFLSLSVKHGGDWRTAR